MTSSILTVFPRDNNACEPKSGSSIRLKGYTAPLINCGVKYNFLAAARPSYVHPSRFRKLKVPKRIVRMIKLHNLIYNSKALWVFAKIIEKIIKKNKEFNYISEVCEGTVLWSHGPRSIPLFLNRINKQKFIYDIHGLAYKQKIEHKSRELRKKIKFWLNLNEEKQVIKAATVVNAISENMKQEIVKRFSLPENKVYLAPDGLLQIPSRKSSQEVQNKKKELGLDGNRVILYIGAFVNFNGVQDLIESFINSFAKSSDAKLLLVGDGSVSSHVEQIINQSKISDKVVRILRLNYSEIGIVQKMSDVQVCPNIDNKNNRLAPHIKYYDALAGSNIVVLPDFKEVRQVFREYEKKIEYFEPSNVNDLSRAIQKCLDNPLHADFSSEEMKPLTYEYNCKQLINQYIESGLLVCG